MPSFKMPSLNFNLPSKIKDKDIDKKLKTAKPKPKNYKLNISPLLSDQNKERKKNDMHM